MSKNRIYGISYTSRKFAYKYESITQQGNECGLFDEFKCFQENDIDEKFIKIHEKIWSDARGGGWWIWKPYIIYKKLLQIKDNDILIYLDGGCTINITEKSKQRFNEYIEMVTKHDQGLLRFQLEHQERMFTNKVMFHYFHQRHNISLDTLDDFAKSRQFVGGILIMRKTPFVMDFYRKIMEMLKIDEYLFTDKYTEPNELHRNDQSAQSLLYKVMNGTLFLEDETYFNDGFGSLQSQNFPFWATRTTL
jgi:hypothetical protein